MALQEVPRPNRSIDTDTRQDRPITPRSQDIIKSGDWGGERYIFHHQQPQESDNLHLRQETTSIDLSKQLGFLTVQNSFMNDYNNLLTELEQQLNELTETNANQNERIQKLTAVNQSLRVQNEQLQGLISRLTAQNSRLNSENNRLMNLLQGNKSPR